MARRPRSFILKLVACLSLLLGAAVPATTRSTSTNALSAAHNVQLLGHIGGVADAVFVQGNYAYAGFGLELAILDLSDPVHLPRLSYVLLPDIVTDIYVVGHYAYVTCGPAGLRIIDITNPLAPVEVGFSSLHGLSGHVVVAGPYAYVVQSDAVGGLTVLDVSNPAMPVEVGRYSPASSGLTIADGYLYVTDWDAGLQVLDLADPRTPIRVGSYNPPGAPRDVAVVGDHAYLATTIGLRVVDVSNPAAPAEVAFNDTFPAPGDRQVVVEGHYAYITDYSGALRIVDITNPAAPSQVSIHGSPNDPRGGGGAGLAIQGTHAYIADFFAGIRVVDVSNVTAPFDVGAGSYAAPAYPMDVVANNYVYAGGSVVDVSRVDGPVRVGTYPGQITTIVGSFAYGRSSNAIQVLDISNPVAPLLVSTYPTLGSVLAIGVGGGYAYVSDGGQCSRTGCVGSGIHVVDISNPADPAQVSFTSMLRPTSIVVDGQDAYVTADGRLYVLDVSDPTQLATVGSYTPPPPGNSVNVAVADSYAYVATHAGGLRIVDISVPTTPHEVGAYPIPVFAVAVANGYAYLTTESGLRVVTVSDSALPVEVGSYDLPKTGFGTMIAVSDDSVYVANYGLFVLRLTEGALPSGVRLYLPVVTRDQP